MKGEVCTHSSGGCHFGGHDPRERERERNIVKFMSLKYMGVQQLYRNG